MSKKALAESELSTDFRRLVGHESARGVLVQGGGAHPFPSLIFAGPRGVGKRLAGLWYAAYLNCLASDEARPCGACLACSKVITGNHPDVSFVAVPESKTVIGVGEIREAILGLGYVPFEGRTRVTIIEQADKLSNEAQNALLKTLEEPPTSSVLILVTSLEGALIPTVTSRCRVVAFYPLADRLVQEELVKIGAPPDLAVRLARLSQGSLGCALEFFRDPKTLDNRTEVLKLFSQLSGQGLWGATDTAQRLERLATGGLEGLLELGLSVYRDFLMLSVGCPELGVHEDLRSDFELQVQAIDLGGLRRSFELFRQAQLHRRSHVNPKILLQRLCVGLAQLGRASEGD